jgi:hypothetical protein
MQKNYQNIGFKKRQFYCRKSAELTDIGDH